MRLKLQGQFTKKGKDKGDITTGVENRKSKEKEDNGQLFYQM